MIPQAAFAAIPEITQFQATPNPVIVNQTTTFQLTTVNALAGFTIDFGDGSPPVTGPLPGGSASVGHVYATTGTFNATASIDGIGDGDITASVLVNVVSASSTSLTSSQNPSTFGQAVTFTATVTGTNPTGTIQFKDTITGNLGTPVPLAGGIATFTTSSLTAGPHTIIASYIGDTNNAASDSLPFTQNVQAVSGTSLASSQNPSMLGQAVTFTATVTGSGTPAGTVQFKDGGNNLGTPVTLSGGVATFTTSTLILGTHPITASYSGDTNNAAGNSAPLNQSVIAATTTTALTSSKNPSEVGQAVTFTATVTSAGGTPTGTVNFLDGATAIGSATLTNGIATFTTASLTLGSHNITASFAATASFSGSSASLVQAVSTPIDSLRLRAMQLLATTVAAQTSGQAISGAIDNAISEAFAGGGAPVTPSGSGMHFNFAADPDAVPANSSPRSIDPFSSANGSFGSTGRGFTNQPSRVNDAFGALGYAGPTKAPPQRYVEPSDWLGWAEVRGTSLDRWGTGSGLGVVAGVPMLYGDQVNLLAGLTRRLLPNFLVGVLGGYETFDYRSDALQGHLKGDGWTVGSYLGWKITENVRFDAAVAYSGIGYDGTAGTAAGSFSGNRLLVSGGLTGTYRNYGLIIEPSAKVYALWERESAYTDTLGTLQAQRDFSAGRASGGVKLSYPTAWISAGTIAPYVGLYGDYYFNNDDAGLPVAAAALASPIPLVLEGWSARAIGGVAATFGNGGQVTAGFERSGIGGNVGIWTYRARASVPFGAQ